MVKKRLRISYPSQFDLTKQGMGGTKMLVSLWRSKNNCRVRRSKEHVISNVDRLYERQKRCTVLMGRILLICRDYDYFLMRLNSAKFGQYNGEAFG